jgi:hypothetical protein
MGNEDALTTDEHTLLEMLYGSFQEEHRAAVEADNTEDATLAYSMCVMLAKLCKMANVPLGWGSQGPWIKGEGYEGRD